MTTEPRFPRSVQAFQRPTAGNRDPNSGESKCVACGQTVDAMMDRSLEQSATAVACTDPVDMRGKVAKKRPPNDVDLEKVLHFSQQLYAHALTLQELIRNDGEISYEVLRPRYDRQAARQFEVFYHTLKRSPGSRKRDASACE